MQYPSRTDYQTAMCNVRSALVDPALRASRIKCDALKLPLVASGAFSAVFRAETGGKTWALRCFIADIGDAAAIYAAIDRHLRQIRSPYFVGFEFQKDGIWVGRSMYPIVKMEWAQGDSLKAFLKKNLANPHAILALADAWRRMLASLATSRIAHGDLQHDNLVIHSGSGGPEIKLIDYDTVVVPDVAGWTEHNAGLPAYQHPGRKKVAQKYLHVDNFSAMAVHASLVALGTNPRLWQEFDVERSEGLLFEPTDFDKPRASRAFDVLRKLGGECARLGTALIDACRADPLQVPSLDDVLGPQAPRKTQPPTNGWWMTGPPRTPIPTAVSPGPAQTKAPIDWWLLGATPTPASTVTSPISPAPSWPTLTPATNVGVSAWTSRQVTASEVFPAFSTPPPSPVTPSPVPPSPVPPSPVPPSLVPPSPVPPSIAPASARLATVAPPTPRPSKAINAAASPPPPGELSPAAIVVIVILVLTIGIVIALAASSIFHHRAGVPALPVPEQPAAAPTLA